MSNRDQSLREIRRSTSQSDSRRVPAGSGGSKTGMRKSVKSKSAPEYVAAMNFDVERRPVMSELAKRFQEKTFLPTFGDIRFFCESYGINVPASNSRAGSIPRVFKFMATMDRDEIQRIADYRRFSGPARLGPIADAIREHGRAAAFRNRRVRAADETVAGHAREA